MNIVKQDSIQRCAYIFPGQGSQKVGMGRDLYFNYLAARKVFDQVDEALNTPLSNLIFEGPSDDLENTVNSQPAIMAVSLAYLEVARENFPDLLDTPHIIAGHSLGEYTSLVVANVLTITDAIKLVQQRGKLMERASEIYPGGMAAIFGLDESNLVEICSETGVQIANINSPNQIVISGDKTGLSRAIHLSSERGAKKAIPLSVSGAFHSKLMEPALKGLTNAIAKLDFHNPSVPIIANCTGKTLTSAKEIKKELSTQLSNCVNWNGSMHSMIELGVTTFFEFGPGKVLTSLIRRTHKEVQTLNSSDFCVPKESKPFHHTLLNS